VTFEDAVKTAPPPVSDAYQPGKQALKGEHRDQVACRDPRRFTGSVGLEAALNTSQGQMAMNPWDYGIGFREGDGREVALWIEVHPASTTEVSTVLKKLAWLQNWLSREAPALHALTSSRSAGKSYFWLATTSGVHITDTSPQARRLRLAGLDLPRRTLELR
jgi:hypothetical protein